jgi:hypothetical protein
MVVKQFGLRFSGLNDPDFSGRPYLSNRVVDCKVFAV